MAQSPIIPPTRAAAHPVPPGVALLPCRRRLQWGGGPVANIAGMSLHNGHRPAATAATLGDGAGDGLPTPARHWAMLTVILGIGMSVLDSTMVTLALPGIVRDLQIQEADGVWLLNAYQLAVLVLLLPLSMVGDRRSPTRAQ